MYIHRLMAPLSTSLSFVVHQLQESPGHHFIIFPKCFPGGRYKFEGPDDALYGKSDSGWIDGELFLTWLKKIFIKYIVSQRPVVLLIDGHSTHSHWM